MVADTPNEALSQLLACVSWSGERLAREICRVLGAGAIHPSAPYTWLTGHRPRREEVRQATAFVLSHASARVVTVGELWPGCAAHDPLLIPATEGMALPWTLAGTLAIVCDWLLGGWMASSRVRGGGRPDSDPARVDRGEHRTGSPGCGPERRAAGRDLDRAGGADHPGAAPAG